MRVRVITLSMELMDSGKSTIIKPLAYHYGATYLSINNKAVKKPNGEDEWFDVSEAGSYLVRLNSLGRQKRSFLAEVGGDAFPSFFHTLRDTEWPDYFDLILIVFNVNNQSDLLLPRIDQLVSIGVPKDRLLLILNQVSASTATFDAAKKVKAGCLERGITVCPVEIPASPVFKLQDRNGKSVLERYKEKSLMSAWSDLDAASDSESEKRAAIQVVRSMYLGQLWHMKFMPLFQFLDQHLQSRCANV